MPHSFLASIPTEGIRYTGSKREIIPRIAALIKDNTENVRHILDGCAGTTRVSQAFKQLGYQVTCNDLADYTQVFGRCYLLNRKPPSHYADWLSELNALDGEDGWFTENYGGLVTSNPKGDAIQADGSKRPWQVHNTRKLDAIRRRIPELTSDPVEQSVLLTSLILAMDKVDNTMGHQVAYLKKWAARSHQTMTLKMPKLLVEGGQCRLSQRSIFDVDDFYDLVYLDPPYGTNNLVTKTTRVRYRSYYHIWTTICRNDRPSLHGAAFRRKDASSDKIPGALSVFESTKTDEVYAATAQLLAQLNCRYILFSYNNKGKLSPEALRELFSPYTTLAFLSFDHKEHAMKKATINEAWLGDQGRNQEFLILVEKSLPAS